MECSVFSSTTQYIYLQGKHNVVVARRSPTSLVSFRGRKGALPVTFLSDLIIHQTNYVLSRTCVSCASYFESQALHLCSLLSQVVYSLTPLWSAGFAYLTLGGGGNESMGTLSWVGGAVILAASFLASQQPQQAKQA